MRLMLLVLAAELLTGCKQQPQRQQKMSDAAILQIHREMPGMTDECLDKLKWGGTEALPQKYEDCFRFSAPQRMQGLWRNQFEGSEFCEASGRCPDAKVDADPAAFTALGMGSPLAGREDTPPGGLYAIDFVGRRSVGAGMFGHMGMAKNEVIVDRLISIREVEAPPRQPTRAEFIKDIKACEARKTCVPNWSYINSYDEAQEKKKRIEHYLKECAGKQICMPNSEVPKRK